MSSQKVYLQWGKNQTKLPNNLYEEGTRKLGSSLVAGTSDVLRGFTPEQEVAWLPSVVACQPTDPNFPQKCRDFWCDLQAIVPSGDGYDSAAKRHAGLELEVGMITIGEKEQPINIRDYAIYKVAQKHSKVALSREEANVGKSFVLIDPTVEKAKTQTALEVRMQAQKEFIANQKNISKLRQVLNLCSVDTAGMDEQDILLAADREITENPKRFYETITSSSLDTQALLFALLRANIISKVGNRYLYGEDVVGVNEKDAILNLQDPAKSEQLVRMKAALEAAPAV